MKNMAFLKIGFLFVMGFTFAHGEKPRFRDDNGQIAQLIYDLEHVKENHPVGTPITDVILECIDPDNEETEIRIDLGTTYVKFDPFKRLLLIKQLDREIPIKPDDRKIAFLCKNTKSSPEFDRKEIILVIIDVNDNRPTFKKDDNEAYFVVIPEDTATGEMIYDNIFVNDIDGPSNNEVKAICKEQCDIFSVTAKSLGESGKYKFEIRTLKSVRGRASYTMKISAEDVPRSNEPSLEAENDQNVVITIRDIQDLAPEFAYKPLSFSINEDHEPNTVVSSRYVGAYDQDTGDPNNIRLELFPHPLDTNDTFIAGLFELGPIQMFDTGTEEIWQAQLWLRKSVDRESIVNPAKILRLRVMAIEYPPADKVNETRNPMNASDTLEITILDKNDERPMFNEESYVIEVPERERITDTNFYRQISNSIDIIVRDRDGQKFNKFTVSIVAGNDDNAYILDSNDGQGQQDFTILAKDGILDYDANVNNRQRQLTLRAVDSIDSSLFSQATVVIKLTDENDNSPKFEQESYIFTLNEGMYYDAFVGRIVATDEDSGDLGHITKFSFTGSFVQGRSKFTITNNGSIFVDGDIDYEDTAIYAVTVTAFDGGTGNNQRSADVGVQILINNIPDRGPRFKSSKYETFNTEGLLILEPEVTVKAENRDGDGAITYSVNSTAPYLPGYFQIPDSSVGTILLTRPINYKDTITPNQRGIVLLKVQACISGQTTQIQLCSSTNVVVTVRDQNNFPPQFIPTNYYETTLSELALQGYSVLQVTTIDRDNETDPLSNNAKVIYKTGQGTNDDFQISSDSGVIQVHLKAKLDADEHARYEILVIATDQGSPAMSATATVVINLEDANNKNPSFTETTYFLNVKDNATIGTPIPPPVSATDPDRDHRIEYSLDFSNLIVELKSETIKTSDILAQQALAIDSVSGMIRTNSLLDLTKYDVITFGVIAEDTNIDKNVQPIQTATASVILFILGVADTSPYYIGQGIDRNNPVIQLSRSESDLVNWKLMSLSAYDPLNSRFIETYEEIEGTDENDYFQIVGTSGYGIVRVKQKIDYEELKPPVLTVGIRAKTPDGRSTDATVRLEISDVNDNAPKFDKPSYTFQVSEGAGPLSSEVGSVIALDADSGTYGMVIYSLDGVNSRDFRIEQKENERHATIEVNAALDYETIPRYTLYVTATDNPTDTPGPDNLSNQQLKTTVIVIINVLDENDNRPIFEQDEYKFSVVGTKAVNDDIGFILATDLDKGVNGDIQYSASSGVSSSDAREYVKVDTPRDGTLQTGRIRVAKNLQNLTDNSIFMLTVLAKDNGFPQMTGTTLVQITVNKGVRDPKPKWDFGLVSIVDILEDKKEGYPVANITAHPANSSSAVTYNFITAGDTEGDYSKFSIDPMTGHVTLAGDLDYETKTSYSLLIRASDIGNLSLTNQFLLTIRVIDIDDNIPAFNACREVEYPIPVLASVREDAKVPTYVHTAIACDLDSDQHNRVRYSWHYDNKEVYGDKTYCRQDDMDLFSLNSVTGEIYTAAELDREVKDSHLLCIAVDPLTGTGRRKRDMTKDLEERKNHHKVLYVLVSVTDANDKGPKFINNTDRKVILEYPPYTVIAAKAYDEDLDPYNIIRYTIDKIIYTKGRKSYQAPTAFNIDSKEGIISRGTYDYSDYIGGHFTIDVRAADARGEYNETDTMTITVFVGHSSDQVRVVFNKPADTSVELQAKQMIEELNGLKEAGVYYEIVSIGYHIVSNAEDPVFDRTDVCMVIVRNQQVMTSLDSVKRLSNTQAVTAILNKYGAIDPGPCEPARSVYPVGWESYWWVLVAFAFFIFVITLILIIIVVFLHRSYKNYMDSHKTYLVPGN